MDKLLHIYGQESQHDDVVIVGNVEALEELLDTINKALCGVPLFMDASVGDGEGYQLKVCLVDGDCDTPIWQKLAVPYTKDYAKEVREDATYPWFLLQERPERDNESTRRSII